MGNDNHSVFRPSPLFFVSSAPADGAPATKPQPQTELQNCDLIDDPEDYDPDFATHLIAMETLAKSAQSRPVSAKVPAILQSQQFPTPPPSPSSTNNSILARPTLHPLAHLSLERSIRMLTMKGKPQRLDKTRIWLLEGAFGWNVRRWETGFAFGSMKERDYVREIDVEAKGRREIKGTLEHKIRAKELREYLAKAEVKRKMGAMGKRKRDDDEDRQGTRLGRTPLKSTTTQKTHKTT